MSPDATLALFLSMLLLAALPSVSTLAVASRTLSHGLSHGIATTLGIITGDLLFIALATYGLSLAASWFDPLFLGIQLLGALYLIWLAFALWKSSKATSDPASPKLQSKRSSYLAGLLITLGDQKAILFYIGFLPAFTDLTNIQLTDVLVIFLCAALSIAIAKLSYALLTQKTGAFFKNPKATRYLNRFSAVLMLALAITLVLKIAIR